LWRSALRKPVWAVIGVGALSGRRNGSSSVWQRSPHSGSVDLTPCSVTRGPGCSALGSSPRLPAMPLGGDTSALVLLFAPYLTNAMGYL